MRSLSPLSKTQAMNASNQTTSNLVFTSWVWDNKSNATSGLLPQRSKQLGNLKIDLLKPLRNWLDSIQVNDPKQAHTICKHVPAQCPFERDIQLFGRTLLHIPPLCKLNPLYDEVVSLRFRALCYLADECGEDVTSYC